MQGKQCVPVPARSSWSARGWQMGLVGCLTVRIEATKDYFRFVKGESANERQYPRT